MRLSHRLVERYVLAAILPYLILSLLLLTAVLLAQQATRFAEILGNVQTPFELTAEVMLALGPNILLLTLPMATLIGTATGFSRLGSDSELVALKAAGIGRTRIVAPVLLLGLCVSALTLYDGLELAPAAARLLRRTAMSAALYKLTSPVEPNSFNTDLPGKVIYVRDGDIAQGQWGRVFIHWQDEGEPTRIVTARTGRIDTSGAQSELVLSDAVVTTLGGKGLSDTDNTGQIVTERSAQLRVRLNTGREALVRKLATAPADPDELDWQGLLELSRSTSGAPQRAALLALHKRLALCLAPLTLGLLGAGLGVRVRRGGRALGVLLSLAAMILYYLALLGGDQLGRSGRLPPQLGAWIATALMLSLAVWLLLRADGGGAQGSWRLLARRHGGTRTARRAVRRRSLRYALLGLLDRGILRALTLNFLMALTTLVAIFLIFTLFELLRYLDETGAKLSLLARYLFYLVPLAVTSIAPVSMLIAVLITYALLTRRSEVVAWWAAGQSVYRLALPGLLVAAAVGGGLWLLQEHLLPAANRKQEALRTQIRGGGTQAVTEIGRQWLALPTSQRIYSYRYDDTSDTLEAPAVFEFDQEGVHLKRIIMGRRGSWSQDQRLQLTAAQVLELRPAEGARRLTATLFELPEEAPPQAFKPALNKPAELNTHDLSAYISTLRLQRGTDVRVYELGLARRRADPFAPLVMACLGLPLALAFGRRAVLAAVSVAVGVGLAFWGSLSGFQQLSQYRLLPPTMAAWAPLLIFLALGAYLFTRTRT